MNLSEAAVRAWTQRGAMVSLLAGIARVSRRLVLTWNKQIVDRSFENV